MDFQRARTKEQIEQRQLDIIRACDTLFDEGGYENVNLKAISEMTTITRSSIYTYYKTKDEIIMDLLGQELIEWKEELQFLANASGEISVEEFSKQLVASLMRNEKMVKHYCLLFSVLEKNCRIEKIVQFKKRAIPVIQELAELLTKKFHVESTKTVSDLVEQMIALIIGLYPAAHLTEKQKEALVISQMGYRPPNFASVCEKGITALLHTVAK